LRFERHVPVCHTGSPARRARRKWVSAATLGWCAALWMGLGVAGTASAETIVLIGDSITKGRVEGGGLSFADQLQALRPQDQIRNAGCPGSTTRDWVRPPIEVRSCTLAGAYPLIAKPLMPADVAIIMLGANDATGYYEPDPVEPPEYRENLEQLVRVALSDAKRVVLLTPTLDPRATGEVRRRLVGYRSAVLETCQTSDCVSCGPDLQRTVSGPAEGLSGLHPDESGHRRIAQQLDAFLTRLFAAATK